MTPVPRDRALALLFRALADPLAARRVRSVLTRFGRSQPATEGDVRAELERLVRSGSLEVYDKSQPTPIEWFELEDEPEVVGGESPLVAELTWIEIELVDEDDNPVAGERYVIEPSDGSAPRQGRLDSRGFAFVDGIPAGKCIVTFPDHDESAWSFVRSTSSPRSRA